MLLGEMSVLLSEVVLCGVVCLEMVDIGRRRGQCGGHRGAVGSSGAPVLATASTNL